MKRPSTPPILSELRTASSSASQVKALKLLKNELIGHEQKKEKWINWGVLTTLAQILSSGKGNGKNKDRENNGLDGYSRRQEDRTEDDEARLQAVIVVGSLAYGGPAFVAPIYAANIISPLLSILSNFDDHRQLTLHALKTLNTIANSICLAPSEQEDNGNSLTTLLYSQTSLSSVSKIIQQTYPTPVVQQQVVLAASIISKTCQKEQQRALAAQDGLLEALAMTAAPLIMGSVRYPFYAKMQTPLPSILDAVKAVVGVAQSRGIQFLSEIDRGLNNGFGRLDPGQIYGPDEPITNLINSKASHAHQYATIPINSLLPQIPLMKGRTHAKLQSGFPIPNQFGVPIKQMQSPRSMSTAIEVNQRQGLEYVSEKESPLIPLLLHIFRSSDDTISLAAAGLLVRFYRLGLTKRPKEPIFAMLLVPSLVRILGVETKTSLVDSTGSSAFASKPIKEEASGILATLTNACLETQIAAFEAGAIRKLSQLLKESFDPIPPNASDQFWNAESTYSPQSQSREDAHRLGPPGISLATYHTLRLREAVLTALAAIASEKDEYRKAVIDNGVVPFVIKSLKAEPPEVIRADSNGPIDGTAIASQQSIWNHRDVALAACGTARALSRSVATLRTSLMDAGLPSPLFSLLKSQDLEIKIAATGVLCNLVLKFSPMRDAIMEGGALKALCAQAHSTNAKLRFNSMWALRNIIAGASNPTKKTCLEELGPGWLKQIVAQDNEDAPFIINSRLGDRDDEASSLIRMSTPNAAGEQVDLLNAVEEDSRDSSQGMDDNEQEDLEMSDSIGALSKADRDKKPQLTAANTDMPLLGLPSLEAISRYYLDRALPDDVAIQKEGLEFIRNLICGDQSPEMIDHLFRELGQDKVFEILTSKLRPKTLNAFNRDRRSTGNGVAQIQQHTEILTSTCYTLIHIACGHPRHRQLLVSQTELLRLLLPLFNHVSREIRTCLCWVVINLTWVEDNTDEQNAKLRARELQNLGFVEKLDGLEKDEILDCRERAKNARDQMKRLLHV